MSGTQLLAPAATAGSAADEAFVRATARPAPRRSATRVAETSAAIVMERTERCRLRACLSGQPPQLPNPVPSPAFGGRGRGPAGL